MWGSDAGRTPELHPAIHTPQMNTQSKLDNFKTNKTSRPHFLCNVLFGTLKHKGGEGKKTEQPKRLKTKVCCEVTSTVLSYFLKLSREFFFAI